MIAHLEGKLLHKSPDYIIVDVHGVGYCVQVPLSTFYELPELGRVTGLNIHTHVREDILQLYGFKTLAEKEMFLHLISITGVGPRLAITILSGISPDELREVIFHQNRLRLQHVPGVGKKIAERIILELRDRLKIKHEEQPSASFSIPSGMTAYTDAFSALTNLGYKPAEAEKALKRAKQILGDDPPLESLLKEALRELA